MSQKLQKKVVIYVSVKTKINSGSSLAMVTRWCSRYVLVIIIIMLLLVIIDIDLLLYSPFSAGHNKAVTQPEVILLAVSFGYQ